MTNSQDKQTVGKKKKRPASCLFHFYGAHYSQGSNLFIQISTLYNNAGLQTFNYNLAMSSLKDLKVGVSEATHCSLFLAFRSGRLMRQWLGHKIVWWFL